MKNLEISATETTLVNTLIGTELVSRSKRASKKPHDGVAFKPNHVEPLINQLLDLLDIYFSEKRYCAELIIKRQQLQLDLKDLASELDLLKQEIDTDAVNNDIRKLEFQRGQIGRKLDLLSIVKANIAEYAHQLDIAAGQWPPHIYQAFGEREKAQFEIEAVLNENATINKLIELEARRVGLKMSAHAELSNKLARRIEALSKAGSPLNLDDEITRSVRRVADLVEFAGARAEAADHGMRMIFGHPGINLPSLAADPDAYPDQLLAYARKATAWLAAFSQADQSFTQLVFLKNRLSEKEFKAFLAGERVSFISRNEIYQRYNFLRVKGLSAYFLGGKSPNIELTVSVPEIAEYHLLDKNGQEFSSGAIDQSSISSCFLGRVSRFESLRSPEVCGMVSLLNTSPIGSVIDSIEQGWHITTNKGAVIDDLVLEIHLSGRPK